MISYGGSVHKDDDFCRMVRKRAAVRQG